MIFRMSLESQKSVEFNATFHEKVGAYLGTSQMDHTKFTPHFHGENGHACTV